MPPLQTKFETLHANLQVLNKGQEYMPKELSFPTESHTKVLLLFFPDQNFCFLYMNTWTVLSFKQTINRMELANFWSVLRDLDENLTCFDTIHSKPLLVIDCKRRRKVQRVSLEWARMRLNQDRDREREIGSCGAVKDTRLIGEAEGILFDELWHQVLCSWTRDSRRIWRRKEHVCKNRKKVVQNPKIESLSLSETKASWIVNGELFEV